MKKLYSFFLQLLLAKPTTPLKRSKKRTFFDYSAEEKARVLRAAGRGAQKEQLLLLKAYESRFGRSA